jgi:hypothetical protein
MRNLGGNQQWGRAPFADVAAKGSWGPESDGRYLVRQLALVTNDSGTFGASLTAKPGDGSVETGQAMMDALGSWMRVRSDDIAGGHC